MLETSLLSIRIKVLIFYVINLFVFIEDCVYRKIVFSLVSLFERRSHENQESSQEIESSQVFH